MFSTTTNYFTACLVCCFSIRLWWNSIAELPFPRLAGRWQRKTSFCQWKKWCLFSNFLYSWFLRLHDGKQLFLQWKMHNLTGFPSQCVVYLHCSPRLKPMRDMLVFLADYCRCLHRLLLRRLCIVFFCGVFAMSVFTCLCFIHLHLSLVCLLWPKAS